MDPSLQVQSVVNILSDVLEDAAKLVLALSLNHAPEQVGYSEVRVGVEELARAGGLDLRLKVTVPLEFIPEDPLHLAEPFVLPLLRVLDLGGEFVELAERVGEGYLLPDVLDGGSCRLEGVGDRGVEESLVVDAAWVVVVEEVEVAVEVVDALELLFGQLELSLLFKEFVDIRLV